MAAEPLQQCFVMITDGKDPELDRIGVMLECLRQAEAAERRRILTYLQAWCGDQPDVEMIGGRR